MWIWTIDHRCLLWQKSVSWATQESWLSMTLDLELEPRIFHETKCGLDLALIFTWLSEPVWNSISKIREVVIIRRENSGSWQYRPGLLQSPWDMTNWLNKQDLHLNITSTFKFLNSYRYLKKKKKRCTYSFQFSFLANIPFD